MNAGQRLWCLLVVALVAACGGGSSPQGPSLELQGTASAEVAMSGATVAVKCVTGSAQTTTATDGSWAVSLTSATLPCVVQVSGGGRTYRSAVWGSGPGNYRVNASPLTELVVARLAGAGNTPATFFSGFGSGSATFSSSSLAAALSYLRIALAGLTDLSGVDPISDVMVAAGGSSAGNALGNQVSNFLTQIAAANTTLDDLATTIANGGDNPAPLAPRIVTQPASLSVEVPQAATFTVTGSSSLSPNLVWQVSTDGGSNFTDVPGVGVTGGASGAFTATYRMPTTQLGDNGKVFRLRIVSMAGSVTSDSVTLTVTAPAPTGPVITRQPQSATVAYGQAATFTVEASSALALSYQWQKGGTDIPGATEASYTTPITVGGNNGAVYSVTVTDANGSVLSTSATLTVTGTPVAAPTTLAAGSTHSVAVRGDGSVVSWGNTDPAIGTSLSGLMGVGNDVVIAGTPTVAKNAVGTVFTGAKAVAASQWSTLVLKTDGTVWGWGYAGWGNLGYGTPWAFEQRSPVQAKLANGTALTSVVHLAIGDYSTAMAVTADGSVWGWGQNRYGHLGIGSSSESGQATPVAMLSPSGTGRFAGAVQVAPGSSGTAVLTNSGTVYTVGWALCGQLGDGSTVNRTVPGRVETAAGVALDKVVSIAAGWWHFVAVTADGTAYTWGCNEKGQLGDGSTTSRSRPVLVSDAGGRPVTGIVAAAAGSDFTMFLKSDGTVWATGSNDMGQLGVNSTAANLTNPAVVVDEAGAPFGDVVAVAADDHTLARRKDGTVWAWGSNVYLQLGDMTTISRRNPIKVQVP